MRTRLCAGQQPTAGQMQPVAHASALVSNCSLSPSESYKSRMTTATYRQGGQEFIVVIFCKNAKTWVPAHDPEPTVSVTLLLRACACTAPCDDAAHTRSMAQHGRQVHTRRIKSAPHGHFSFNNAFIMLVQTVAGGLGNMRVPLHSRSAHHTVLRVERSAPALLRTFRPK